MSGANLYLITFVIGLVVSSIYGYFVFKRKDNSTKTRLLKVTFMLLAIATFAFLATYITKVTLPGTGDEIGYVAVKE